MMKWIVKIGGVLLALQLVLGVVGGVGTGIYCSMPGEDPVSCVLGIFLYPLSLLN